MLRNIIGSKSERILAGIGAAIHHRGISANQLTLAGLFVNMAGAVFFYMGYFRLGGFVILFGGLFDMLDGAVARARGGSTKAGGFLDSVVDRYSDFVVLGGILLFFAKKANLTGTILLLIIISGSLLISYTRARAELIIPRCDVGLMERPERIIVLAAGSISGFMWPALWFLAVSTHVTAIHRIVHTLKMAGGGEN